MLKIKMEQIVDFPDRQLLIEMNPVKSSFRTSSRIIYFIYHKKKSVTAERAERNKNYLH